MKKKRLTFRKNMISKLTGHSITGGRLPEDDCKTRQDETSCGPSDPPVSNPKGQQAPEAG